jgi:hypothetical protein
VKLTDKQIAKIDAIIEDAGLNKLDDVSAASLKAARKVEVKKVKAYDKALLVYDIDLALDEAKALIEKKGE